MKRLAGVLWLFGIIVHTMSSTGIYFLFQVNCAYVITQHCEIRMDPVAACKGKCYLKMESIKDIEQKHLTTPNYVADLALLIQGLNIRPLPAIPLKVKHFLCYLAGNADTPVHAYFHPPTYLI